MGRTDSAGGASPVRIELRSLADWKLVFCHVFAILSSVLLAASTGSPGRQITNFTSQQITSFHWSPDGKSLGVLSNHPESDVVLLQESK